MSRVPLDKHRDAGIDDAHFLDQAIDAYSSWFSGEFIDTWAEALDRFTGERIAINLVPAEEATDRWHAVTLNRSAEGLDDAHYLDFAISVYRAAFSDSFNRNWPPAYAAMLAGLTPIDLVEGEDIVSDNPPALPEFDIALPDPPKPTELPA